MSKPYDATAKDILETDPAGWVRFFGFPVDAVAVRLVDADVSTITAEADKVIFVDGSSPWILHLEFQVRWELALGRRILRYNALLHHRHGVPVVSVVVLFQPTTNPDALTGLVAIRPPIGRSWDFPFEILRVWEQPAADFLKGSLGVLPLALIGDVSQAELPSVVKAMQSRISGQPDRALAAKLWTASYFLMGLRYEPPIIDNLLSGVMQMEESTTYQAVLNRGVQQGVQQGVHLGVQQGAVAEARDLLFLVGGKRLGPPSAAIRDTIAGISEKIRLESILLRTLTAASWEQALQPE
ncbi:MAG TPA: hypothetical protein VGL71_15025 [Urbifossiella sp.]|jgi:predicted transposase YdaD